MRRTLRTRTPAQAQAARRGGSFRRSFLARPEEGPARGHDRASSENEAGAEPRTSPTIEVPSSSSPLTPMRTAMPTATSESMAMPASVPITEARTATVLSMSVQLCQPSAASAAEPVSWPTFRLSREAIQLSRMQKSRPATAMGACRSGRPAPARRLVTIS
jgi:hypothetical protein